MRARDNPFAKEILEKRLAYDPTLAGLSWGEIDGALEARGYRCAIAGPHGTGKSTLLDALAIRLQAQEFHVRRLFFNDEAPPSVKTITRKTGDITASTIVLCDGAERLSALHWLYLRLRTRSAAGLVITVHGDSCRLPTAIRLESSRKLFEALLDRLGVTETHPNHEWDRYYAESEGNLRTALTLCYLGQIK